MKNLFSIIFLLLISASVFGQKTVPRFGIKPNEDNTGRVLTYNYQVYTFVAGVDSLKLSPNAYQTIVNAGAMVDSLTIQFKNIKSSYVGDMLSVIGYGSGASYKLKVGVTNCASSGVLVTGVGKYVTVRFIFDGIKWVEQGRFVQP